MKKLSMLFALFLFSIGIVFSQKTFQGAITYEIKFMGEGSEQMGAFAPNSYTYTVLKNDIRFKMEGGMAAMMGEFIIKGKTGETFVLRESEQMAYKLKQQDTETPPKPVVTAEDEVITVAGYECKKYKVVSQNAEMGEMISYVWATNALKFPDNKNTKNVMGLGTIYQEGVEGVPLKIMNSMNTMGMSITMVVTANEVNTNKPSSGLFKIPKGFKVEETTADALMGM